MKVFIIIDQPQYEQGSVVAVCSTETIANEYIENNKPSGKYNDLEIEEWSVLNG